MPQEDDLQRLIREELEHHDPADLTRDFSGLVEDVRAILEHIRGQGVIYGADLEYEAQERAGIQEPGLYEADGINLSHVALEDIPAGSMVIVSDGGLRAYHPINHTLVARIRDSRNRPRGNTFEMKSRFAARVLWDAFLRSRA